MIKIAIPGYEGKLSPYCEALRQLGAEPEIIWDKDASESCSGLLLPGGCDVAPERYGQKNTACGTIDTELDAVQFAALLRFTEKKKPVFGICRGEQLLNVFFGGTLVQHLPSSAIHAAPAGDTIGKRHLNRSADGGIIRTLYGSEFVSNSFHHQAVDIPGEGLKITLCSEDGVVEAVEHQSLPVLGVQFHPERMCSGSSDTADGRLILDYFLSLCKNIT